MVGNRGVSLYHEPRGSLEGKLMPIKSLIWQTQELKATSE